MPQLRTSLAFLVLLILVPGSASASDRIAITESELDKAIQRIPAWDTAGYSLKQADHVGPNEKLVQHPKETARNEFNCTTFSSPVLHLLVHGKLRGFKQSKTNGYGHQVARYFGLAKNHSWADIASFKRDAASEKWRVANAGVYYFDLRKGTAGHVGFLVVSKHTVRQIHYSGMNRYKGLANDAHFLSHFLAESMYRTGSSIALYRVTKPSKG